MSVIVWFFLRFPHKHFSESVMYTSARDPKLKLKERVLPYECNVDMIASICGRWFTWSLVQAIPRLLIVNASSSPHPDCSNVLSTTWPLGILA